MSRRRKRSRKGAIIVLVAICIPVILILAGFAVDLANMQRTRTELRTTSDMAARAAADELSRTGDVNAARLAGKAIGQQNTVAGQTLTFEDSDFVFGRSEKQADGTFTFTVGGTPLNSVKVTGNRTEGSAEGPIGLFFGRVYGRPSFETSFQATATFVDVDICLVLDRSSSMKLGIDEDTAGIDSTDPRACTAPQVGSRWEALENGVAVFTSVLNGTPAQEQVAVVTFGGEVAIPLCTPPEDTEIVATDVGLTFDMSLVDQAMINRGNAVWNGNTDIEAGIERGTQILTGAGARVTADKIMIVLTDGNKTHGDTVAAAAAANAAGITVHTITFSDFAGQQDMIDVADEGKGEHNHAVDAASLNAVFEKLAAAIAILTE